MVDVIDQSWVFGWQNSLMSSEEANCARTWLRAVPAEFINIVKQFPPLSLVRGKRALEVPFLFTVGIVTGYAPDGKLLVKQEPDTEAVLVAQEDLEVVGFWKSLSTKVTEQLLPQRIPHAQPR